MLQIRALSKTFGSGASGYRALRSVDLTVNEGEFFTLLGPSGCGKTTLLRLIAGFEPASSGQIVLDGKDIAAIPPNRRPVNTVFQNYALFPHLSVAQNVAFGLQAQGRPAATIAARVERMLALVQMTHLRDRRSAELSGGQQQRVALARALAPGPRILLLDEPLSALDLKLRKDMQTELKRLQRETGLTFVFVTHDQDEALTMSDRIGVMHAGRLQQVAAPQDLYDRPANRFVAGFIGETNFLAGHAGPDGVVLAGQPASPVPGSTHLPAGPVTLMIRPEHVVLGPDAPPGLMLQAHVERLVFGGTHTQAFLRLPWQEPLAARLANPPQGRLSLAEGDSLPVCLPFAALRFLPPEAADDA